MNRVQVRDAVFWVLWSWNVIATLMAVSAEGLPQIIGEYYLAVLAVANSAFIARLVTSESFQESISMNVDRRRTPHSVEWAGALIMVLVGYMLSNYLILLGGVIAIVTKKKTDAIQEKLRVETLPLRAIRDGVIHKDEMSK